MGNSGSKAAQNNVRKFPTRAPGVVSRSEPRASRQQARPSYTKDGAMRSDSIDPERPDQISPAFSDRLKQMGIVQPNPTFSPSSTASPFPDVSQHFPPAPNYPSAKTNATLGVLEARRRLQEQADAELSNMGKSTDRGREFLDIGTLRDILVLRERGQRPADIEAKLRLKPGVVKRLGPLGVVSAVRS